MPQRSNHCHFHCAWEFITPILAHMLDSLVRVSRRGKENHFVRLNQIRQQLYLTQSNLTIAATALHPQVDTEIWRAGHWFPSLQLQQFQVLFNSLFKVLCIFPSRYLYAIGLPPIFSFRWNLPPTLSCNPKQLDSKVNAHCDSLTGVSPSLLPFSKGLQPPHNANTPQFNSGGAIPASVALTGGILVSFFSSA